MKQNTPLTNIQNSRFMGSINGKGLRTIYVVEESMGSSSRAPSALRPGGGESDSTIRLFVLVSSVHVFRERHWREIYRCDPICVCQIWTEDYDSEIVCCEQRWREMCRDAGGGSWGGGLRKQARWAEAETHPSGPSYHIPKPNISALFLYFTYDTWYVQAH